MVYPSKIAPSTIVAATMNLLQNEGQEALSLRRIAKDLGVTANALYKYFPSHEILLAAAADSIAQMIHAAIEDSLRHLPDDADPEVRLTAMLKAYLSFAENNVEFYTIFLKTNPDTASALPEPHYYKLLWPQVVSLVEPITGAEDAPAASVALWGMLHGIWALRQAGVLGGIKPDNVDDYAFAALIRGLKAS
jgi:AcrR family transcriptional regulator